MSNLHRSRVQLYNNRILNYFLDKEQSSSIDKGQLSHLKAIMTGSKGLNEFHTSYNFKIAKNASDCTVAKLGYGRIYGSIGSAEYLDYNYRDNLYADTEHDIDMKNCHPTLLIQLAKNKGLTLKNLEAYVENREENLQRVIEFYKEQGKEVTRSDVKTEIISVLYGAKLPTFKTLHNEFDALISLLKLEHAELWTTVSALKQKNREGAFLSYIAQTEERRCLDALDCYFLAQGRSVDGLAYDGLMVRKTKPDEIFPTDLLRCAEVFVKEKTGYAIGLEIKPMMKSIDDSKLLSREEKEYVSYSTLKARFEESHFYFVPTGSYCEIRDNKISHYTDRHATIYFNTWILGMDKKGESIPFFPQWVKDPTRRMIHEFVYKKAEECSSTEFPLFMGFAYQHLTCEPSEEEEKTAIAHFQDLVMAVCDDEQVVADHVIKGFAHLIQKPYEKTNVITAFASPIEGAGKDTLMGIITRLVGNGFTAHYTSTEQFWDKHNDMSVGKGFIYLEEACSSMNKTKQGELKARATAASLSINPKGTKGFECPNIGRMYMTTNETEPFKVSKQDRRGFIIAPGGRLVGSDWVSTYKMIMKEWYIVAIGHFLESIDLTAWDATKFPDTAVKTAMKELAVSSEEIFLKQWVCDEWIDASEMYRQYSEYCTREHLSHAQNVKSFGVRLIHLSAYFQKKRSNIAVLYKSLSVNPSD